MQVNTNQRSDIMRTLTTTVIVLLLTTGCSSEFATGGAVGTGLGALFQNTIAGAEKDLETRELALVDAYNKGIEMGMEQESLDGIAKEIERTRLMRGGVEVSKKFLGVDWSNPQQTSMAFASLIELGLIVYGGNKLRKTGKELRGTKAGINKFCGVNEAKVAGELHDIVKAKVNST